MKKSKIFIVVFLMLFILILGTFFVIKFSSKKNNDNDVENKFQETIKERVLNIYPKENDSSVIVAGTITKISKVIEHNSVILNQEEKIENTDLMFTYNSENCGLLNNSTVDENSSFEWCDKITVSLNNNILFSVIEDVNDGNYGDPYIIITKDYVIFQIPMSLNGVNSNMIGIYNYNGKKMLEISNVASEGTFVGNNTDLYNFHNADSSSVMRIKDGKLYFIEYNVADHVSDNNLSINYIDLENKFKKITIEKFNGCALEKEYGVSCANKRL